jgi:ubiquitin-protein ligase E3 B
MFNASESKKDGFLEQTKAAREERAQEKRRDQAATSIQAYIRGWLSRKRFAKEIL